VNRIKARKIGAREDEKGYIGDELWQKNSKHLGADNSALLNGIHGINLRGIPEGTLIEGFIAAI
jgi:hypothetical protein